MQILIEVQYLQFSEQDDDIIKDIFEIEIKNKIKKLFYIKNGIKR